MRDGARRGRARAVVAQRLPDGDRARGSAAPASRAARASPTRSRPDGRDYANLEADGRAELARHGWQVDYVAVRHGLGLRIPHPEAFDHPNLLIVLGAAKLGATRLIDNVDVVPMPDVD